MLTDAVSSFQARAWLRPEAGALEIGYVPLTDAAPLLVAEELGFFARHGVAIRLSQTAGWAALRDRVAFGGFDGAQMLSPLPIALRIGLGGVQRDTVVGATLGLNGNVLTLSKPLAMELADGKPLYPMPAEMLAGAITRRRAQGRPDLVIAVVFPFSSHNYLLRRWLASGGIDPETDLRLVVVPPSEMPTRMADGDIDGFCVGEPWGSRAVDLDVGRIVLATADIWPDHPEKVLVFPADLVARDRPLVVAGVAAVIEAGRWIAAPGNLPATVDILCRRALPSIPREIVSLALEGRFLAGSGETPTKTAPLRVSQDVTYPDPAHGRRWLAEMRAWAHVPAETDPDMPNEIWEPALWLEAMGLVGPQ